MGVENGGGAKSNFITHLEKIYKTDFIRFFIVSRKLYLQSTLSQRYVLIGI